VSELHNKETAEESEAGAIYSASLMPHSSEASAMTKSETNMIAMIHMTASPL
jgi:hypothetical protein